jgi:arylsulfatase A-like enzyme
MTLQNPSGVVPSPRATPGPRASQPKRPCAGVRRALARWAVSLALCLLGLPALAQVPVYQNTGISTAGWFRSTTGGAGASLNLTNEPGFLTWNPGNDVNNVQMLAYFPGTPLGSVGDSLSLRVVYKVTGINATNAGNHRLRMGLGHSGGVQVGDGHGASNPAFTNYNGYFGTFAAPAGAALVQLNQKLQPSAASLIQALGTTNSESLGSTNKSSALLNNTLYVATLTVTRTASGNQIAFSQSGGADWSFTSSDTGGAQGPFYAFDTMAFGVLDAATSVLDDWRFDEISVVYTPAAGGLTPTTTQVRSSKNPSAPGGSVFFTATVTPNPGSGTVQFRTNGVNLGAAVPLLGGQAVSASVSNLALGVTTVSAIYSGNTNYLPSSGSLAQVVSTVLSNAPNFVFIITDDQRWDAMGAAQRELAAAGRARFSWFTNETPGMDRLAREGVRFRNAFVNNAVCTPSRACFLTGQYNHRNSVVHNGKELPLDAVTYASELQKAGYQTLYTGKWHMNQQAVRPGFTHFASFIAQGNYFDQTFLVDGVSTPTTGWLDDVTTDFALKYLSNNAANPFALVVGFKSPHDPRTPRPDLDDLYTGRPILPPVNGPAFPAPYVTTPGGPTDSNICQYFECLKGVDQNVERILNALDGLNLASNTVVVYTSDNGYLFKEHGLGDKRAAYDESLRVPLLVRYPPLGMSNMVRDEVVLNLDLAPTFLDLAGLPIPAGMQGRSWRPLLEGRPPADWRTSWFYEYTIDTGVPLTPSIVALRSPSAKLIFYPVNDAYTELFNLAADPFETNNLAFNPAAQPFYAAAYQELLAQMEAADFQPRMLNLARSGATVNFQVKAGYGTAYRVEKSADLKAWSVLSSYNYVDLAPQLTNSFSDPNATNGVSFYRIRLVER